MASYANLQSVYKELLPDNLKSPADLYVVPLIRFGYKKSDYLYLLYKDIIEAENGNFKIHSTSVWEHWKFVLRAFKTSDVILHYHWLECTNFKSLAGMLYKLLCIILFKKLGGKLVWTVHNKMPHDNNFTKTNFRIRSSMAKRADIMHVHCKSAVDIISEFYNQPKSKFRIIPHPAYPVKFISKENAIRDLNSKQNMDLKLSDQVFMMFGHISSYKQIGRVCEMFKNFADNKKLLVVGPVKKGQLEYYRKIKEASKSHNNIILIPHFVSEEDVSLYHYACDCVVFNYRDILTSGGAALAQSYGKPVIAPRLGCLQELSGDTAHLFDTQEQLQNLLANFPPEKQFDA
jgi:glycosyltransferase involved in cell wall biosynthesis